MQGMKGKYTLFGLLTLSLFCLVSALPQTLQTDSGGGRTVQLTKAGSMAKRHSLGKRSTFSLLIPEAKVFNVTSDVVKPAENATDYSVTSESSLQKKGWFSFAWESSKVIVAPTWYGWGTTATGLACTLSGKVWTHMPQWTKNICFAASFMGPFVNAFQGRAKIQDAYQKMRNQGLYNAMQFRYSDWDRAYFEGYAQRAVSESEAAYHFMDSVIISDVEQRSDDVLTGVHYHEADGSYGLLSILDVMGHTSENPKLVSVSIDGELVFPLSTMWFQEALNGSGISVVSSSVEWTTGVMTSNVKRETANIAYPGNGCSNTDYFFNDGRQYFAGCNPYKYNNANGMIYGEMFYGSEQQFYDIDYNFGGQSEDDNGLAYLGASLSNNAIDSNWKRACACTQAQSTWASTGAYQLNENGNFYGIDDCWKNTCGG